MSHVVPDGRTDVRVFTVGFVTSQAVFGKEG